MTTANHQKLPVSSVQADDGLHKAIMAAQERASKVYSGGRNTLVDQTTVEEWLVWEATEDLAIVADSNGLDDEDDLCLDAAT